MVMKFTDEEKPLVAVYKPARNMLDQLRKRLETLDSEFDDCNNDNSVENHANYLLSIEDSIAHVQLLCSQLDDLLVDYDSPNSPLWKFRWNMISTEANEMQRKIRKLQDRFVCRYRMSRTKYTPRIAEAQACADACLVFLFVFILFAICCRLN